MHRHANAQRELARPALGVQCALNRQSASNRIGGACENRKAAVPFSTRTYHHASAAIHHGLDQLVVPRERGFISSGRSSQLRELPSMSVNRNVTVPVGNARAARSVLAAGTRPVERTKQLRALSVS
jgi:hypothetical protein